MAVVDADLQLLVAYLHDPAGGGVDNDNMVKPIQDALIGVLYVDDRQVTDTVIYRRALANLQALGASPALAAALGTAEDFVYVRVSRRNEEVDFS